MCPAIIKSSQTALEAFSENKPELLIVTLDPWRDTPSSLPTLAKKWELSSEQHILSGEVDQVKQVLEDYQVPADRDEKSGDVSHPPLVYVLDQNAKIAYTFNNPSPSWLIEAAKRVMNEKS